MNFNIRKLNSTDYDEILVKWWNDWGWQPAQKDFLPENGEGGIIIYDGDTPICAGFMYITNSKVSWVDWIISNKDYRKKPNRKYAIELLIEKLTEMCKYSGAKYIYALIKHDGLIESYEKHGYIQGDSYTKEMIKAL